MGPGREGARSIRGYALVVRCGEGARQRVVRQRGCEAVREGSDRGERCCGDEVVWRGHEE